jgi:hypothetical protein
MPNPTASDFNPSFHEQIAAQLYPTGPACSENGILGVPAKAKPRIRQNSKGMNKLEADFFAYAKIRWAGTRVRFNAVSFELANGLRYKPDFTLNLEVAIEVKGTWASRDAFPRLKIAARAYHDIRWFLATRAKVSGGWDLQEVLP